MSLWRNANRKDLTMMKHMSKQVALILLQEVWEKYAIELELSSVQYIHHTDKADEEYYFACLPYGKDKNGITLHYVTFDGGEQFNSFLALAKGIAQRAADYEQSEAERESLARINQNMEGWSELEEDSMTKQKLDPAFSNIELASPE